MNEFSLSRLSAREKDDVILAQASVIARLEGKLSFFAVRSRVGMGQAAAALAL